ncbi:MAG: rhamnogalacturonan acetylesterase [Gemmatimonadetes bacterium]|nr:rhamnogalacturonan acetylesterase [Gemmatimonadota bacterium]
MSRTRPRPDSLPGRLPVVIALLLGAASVAPARAQNAAAAAAPGAPVTEGNPVLPTVYYIGDSTVRNGSGNGGNGEWGWGDLTGEYFDSTRVNVVNRALGGRSSRTYLTQGQWERVRAALKPGDVVIMQFGHNDGGALNDTSRARGSIKGVGDESEAIHNFLTRQDEVVHSFGWYLRKFIADTRAARATPIVASLVPRNIWQNGAVVRNHKDYAGWAKQVAEAEKVPFLDLHEIIAREYEKIGPERVRELFGRDHTHTSLTGATLSARLVIAGLKGLPGDPLSRYFSARAADVPAAR